MGMDYEGRQRFLGGLRTQYVEYSYRLTATNYPLHDTRTRTRTRYPLSGTRHRVRIDTLWIEP